MEVDELVAAAKEEPGRVVTECEVLLATPLSALDRSICLRARSVAERALGDLDASMRTAGQAIEVAEGASLDEQAGLARGTLGASLLYTGQIEQARDALKRGRLVVDGPAGLQLDMHMAGLHARTGEVEQAHQLFGQVAAAAQQHDMAELAGDALANRGTLAGFTGRLDQAEADLTVARYLFVGIDQATAAAQMTHNLGWIAALRGNFQQALDLYRLAADALTGFDFWEDAVHLVDRAEAKLNAGLFSEAAVDATAAAATFSDHAAHADEAEARLVAAHAFLACGNEIAAADQARPAAELFLAQERPGWLAETRLVLARCGDEVDAIELRQIAEELDDAGQRRAALTARLVGMRHDDSLPLDAIDQHEFSLVQAALYEDVVASRRAAEGDVAAALNLIRARFESTAETRATIGSTDVRGGLTAVWGELNERAKSLSWADSDDISLFEFAEWGSLVLVEPPPVAAPGDADVAEALGELRSMHSALRAAERDFEDIGDLPAQIAVAETTLANLTRRARRAQTSHIVHPISVPAVERELVAEDTCLPRLSRFVTADDQLIRIDIDGSGIRSTGLADVSDLVALSTELQLSLERLLAGSRSERLQQVAERTVLRIVTELDAMLFHDVARGALPLMVVPTADLGRIPWSLLPSRAGASTVVLPAASMLAADTDGRHDDAPVGSVVAIAGPGLAHTADEVLAVAAVYDCDAQTLLADDATVMAARAVLAGADIAHLAAHGHLRPDQPMLSSIELADGPLTVFDLHQLAPPPRVVVLANCFSARAVATDGGELIGAAAVLLSAGSSWVIGCPVALPDDAETRSAMVTLHTQLAAGLAVPDAVTTTVEALTGRARHIARSLVVFGTDVRW